MADKYNKLFQEKKQKLETAQAETGIEKTRQHLKKSH